MRRALEAARLARENAELRLRAGTEMNLTGDSAAVSGLRGAIERVAPTGSRVLIHGPAGSGKEVAARMVHAKSRRLDGPFVALNCATLNPARFEEELFGVEAGTDATGSPRRAGVLERAHGGTLLLDEVSDMPLETQGKIVRALQDQTFERLGGSMRVKVDVRVLAITNKDLQAEIAAGRFREDLFYRLAVVPLKMPSLKERREDIPELARNFMARSAENSGIPPRELSADTLAALQAYDWPGNVRQLRNLMDWLLIMAPGGAGDAIRAEMLPPEIGQGAPALLNFDPTADIMALPLREARDLFETQYLQAQLVRFGGNISRTAGFVGMERSALHRKLKAVGRELGRSRRMSRIAYVNGRYVPQSEASVNVEDRGYQFADGVYEVLFMMDGRFLDKERHMARLERSLSEISIAPPMGRAALLHVLNEVARRNRLRDGLLYMQVTPRGCAGGTMRSLRRPSRRRWW